MTKALLPVACALAMVIQTGCIPESEQPITPLATAQQDAQLYGVWRADEEDCVRYLHVGAEVDKAASPDAAEPEPGLMRFWFVTHRKGEGRFAIERPLSMRFFVSHARENHFANAMLPFEEGQDDKVRGPRKYYFIRYKVEGDQLLVWGINFQATAAAIENGELGGTVTRDKDELKSVQLTDSSEHLAVYLSGGGADMLFPDKGKATFQRVR